MNMQVALAYAAALVLTLVLAAFLTPSHWWRRPNLRALAVTGLGTWGIASLILLVAATPATRSVAGVPHARSAPQAPAPARRITYRVFDDLNLRAARGTASPRIAVVPAGALVTSTGLRDGDWWQLSARVDGKQVVGWSSSLWLRRADEG
jgi:hypothetical protein